MRQRFRRNSDAPRQFASECRRYGATCLSTPVSTFPGAEVAVRVLEVAVGPVVGEHLAVELEAPDQRTGHRPRGCAEFVAVPVAGQLAAVSWLLLCMESRSARSAILDSEPMLLY